MTDLNKEERTKLYQENRELYKAARAEFTYGLSQNFRKKRQNEKAEIKELEEQAMEVYQEVENGYNN